MIFFYYPDTSMKIGLPLLIIFFSNIAIASPIMINKVKSEGAVNLNSVGKPNVSSIKTVQQKKSTAVVKHTKKNRSKNLDKKRQSVLTKRDNSDGTVTYKTAGKPTADLSETISLKESKEIDKQAKEIGVQVIDINDQPIMTKKANSDGTVTFNSVGDSKADSPETVPHKQSKDIENQAEETGVKVIEIKKETAITRKVNSDGTVTYNPLGEPRADTPETIPKKEGKEVDDRFRKQGVKIIDVTPKKDSTPQQ